jgi:hypothetical protein
MHVELVLLMLLSIFIITTTTWKTVALGAHVSLEGHQLQFVSKV